MNNTIFNEIRPGDDAGAERERVRWAMNVCGPVPSRRLGRSLCVQNVPPGTCSYDCVYCHKGPTTLKTLDPRPWYDPNDVLEAIAQREARVRNLDGRIDYVTFVLDGEPTLDSNLKQEVEVLRSVGIKTAINTNASLINRAEVREILRCFDRVSVKVDTVDEVIWRRINRPHPLLELSEILVGIVEFSKYYEGDLNTETMLVDGVNDGLDDLVRLADFIERVDPRRAYLSVPERPPSVPSVRVPSRESLARAHSVFSNRFGEVVILAGQAGDRLASSH